MVELRIYWFFAFLIVLEDMSMEVCFDEIKNNVDINILNTYDVNSVSQFLS